jgi:hypothetical protein
MTIQEAYLLHEHKLAAHFTYRYNHGYSLEQVMQKSDAITFEMIMPASVILFSVGWGGLAFLMTFALPFLGPRWLFFLLAVMGVTGTFLPVTYFLNRRFPSSPPVNGDILARQALWFGIYGALLAWFQMGRMLSVAMAFLLAVVFILLEAALRLWEKSRWKPKE